jgi:F0F1-type ATP synthase assembly protein I
MKNNPPKNDSLRYADVAWRMLAVVLLSVLAGWYLDKKVPAFSPCFILIFSLLGVTGSMIMIIREVSKKK